MSLKQRIQILLAFLVGIPLLFLLIETYRTGRQTLLDRIRSDATHTAQFQGARLEQAFENPRLAVGGLVRVLETAKELDHEEILPLLHHTLAQTPEAFGMAVARVSGPAPFAPYVFRAGDGLAQKSLADPSYGLAAQEWYARPTASRRPLWTRPYLDRGGGEVPMITYAAPVLREGRVAAVVSADVSLAAMVEELRRLRPGGEGQVYLLSQEGSVFAHPDRPVLADPSTEDLARLGPLQDLLRHAGMDAVSGRDPFTGKRAWLVEVPLASLQSAQGGQGWSLVVSWPEAVRLRPLRDLGRRFLILYLALGGAALLFLHRSLNDLITRPITRLAGQARRFIEGDFRDLGHPPEEAAEYRALSHALQTLGQTLQARRTDTPPPPPEPGEKA